MKHFTIILFSLFLACTSYTYAGSKKVSINGTVFEKVNDSHIPLSLANVYCEGTVVGTISSEYGDFNLELEEGNHTLIFSYSGYLKVTKNIVVKKRKTNDMYMEVVLQKQDANHLADK